jgi:hypothetical protein
VTVEANRIPLADALAVLLPVPADVRLLRAMHAQGQDAAERWAEWQQAAPDFRHLFGAARPELRRLLPMLDHRRMASDLPVPASFGQLLRAATVWEVTRLRRIGEIFAAVRDALAAAEISPILAGGLAVALTGYAAPHLRHCHDIDLLVDADNLAAAGAALTAAGFQPGAPDRGAEFLHRDGLPVHLHTGLLAARFYRLPEAAMRGRAETISFAGGPVRVLRPADNLLHRLARVAAGQARPGPQWAVDAAALAAAMAADAAAWREFADAAIGAGLALPLAVLLRFVQGVGAVIPADTSRQIETAAVHAGTPARNAALCHAAGIGQVRLRRMFEASSLPTRLAILRWMAAPARGSDVQKPQLYAARYARRKWRELAGRFARLRLAH